MRELSLFSGAGGGLLATHWLLGWQLVGCVESDPFCQEVLAARMRDGCLDTAPIFGDVRAFLRDGYAEQFAGVVDIATAGFPCQPHSHAGKRKGHADERNLWPETLAVFRAVRPRFAMLENVAGLLTSAGPDGRPYFGHILGDLAEAGFDAEWCVLGADYVGAPHRRNRVWILAYSAGVQLPGKSRARTGEAGSNGEGMADSGGAGQQGSESQRDARDGSASERGAVADSRCELDERARRSGVMACASRAVKGEEDQRQRSRDAARDCGAIVPFFPPGPDDLDAWRAVLERWPEIAPATAESDLRRVADGLASILVGPAPARSKRLRALGNGWVPLAALAAWEELTS